MAKVKGIRRRWMLNSISAVLLIVLFAVAAFSAAIASYFYSTMSTGLKSRVTAALPFFSSAMTQSEYLQTANDYVSTFADKDHLELQIINAAGSIDQSTNDLTIPGSYPDTPDVAGAIEQRVLTPWTGTAPDTGERVMSVSMPVSSRNGTLLGVIRMVTSLNRCDIQVAKVVAVALLIGTAIVLLVSFSNLYFVRSIVEPVTAVTETAKRIAAGSYGIQMETKFDDEVGDLTDAINDMSLKIDQSEKMKSEFISSVSHELRTPLTAINGWAETIMNGEVRDAEDVKKGMGIIVSEARRLTNMVEELLEFSRIEDGRFTLSVEPMTSRPSWRMPSTPIRSSSAGRASPSPTPTARRSSSPSQGTRSGCGRSSATCWTTPPSTAAPESASTPPSGERRTPWSSPSGTTAPASLRMSFPMSNTSSTRAAPRPGAPASALPSVRRSSPATMAAWTSATPRAAAASSPSACPSAGERKRWNISSNFPCFSRLPLL